MMQIETGRQICLKSTHFLLQVEKKKRTYMYTRRLDDNIGIISHAWRDNRLMHS